MKFRPPDPPLYYRENRFCRSLPIERLEELFVEKVLDMVSLELIFSRARGIPISLSRSLCNLKPFESKLDSCWNGARPPHRCIIELASGSFDYTAALSRDTFSKGVMENGGGDEKNMERPCWRELFYDTAFPFPLVWSPTT